MDTPWNPKTNDMDAHVYYAAEQEDQLNQAFCSLYNKKRRWMDAASNLPEGNVFRYASFRMKNKIALTAHQLAELKKSKLVQRYAFDCHYPIPLWGMPDCDRIIIVPNGTDITLNQAIMGVKTQKGYKSPLLLGGDTQENGSVIVTCDKSFKEEAGDFLSHLPIYLEQLFGVVVWDTFPHNYKASMSTFAYCHIKQCAVEITAPDLMSCNSSIDTKDSANYLNHMVSKFGLEHHLELEDNQEFSFDLTNQVTLQVGADGGGILGDGGDDAGTINTDYSAPTLGTTKDYLNPPINFLVPPVPVSQATNQPVSQVASQAGHQ